MWLYLLPEVLGCPTRDGGTWVTISTCGCPYMHMPSSPCRLDHSSFQCGLFMVQGLVDGVSTEHIYHKNSCSSCPTADTSIACRKADNDWFNGWSVDGGSSLFHQVDPTMPVTSSVTPPCVTSRLLYLTADFSPIVDIVTDVWGTFHPEVAAVESIVSFCVTWSSSPHEGDTEVCSSHFIEMIRGYAECIYGGRASSLVDHSPSATQRVFATSRDRSMNTRLRDHLVVSFTSMVVELPRDRCADDVDWSDACCVTSLSSFHKRCNLWASPSWSSYFTPGNAVIDDCHLLFYCNNNVVASSSFPQEEARLAVICYNLLLVTDVVMDDISSVAVSAPARHLDDVNNVVVMLVGANSYGCQDIVVEYSSISEIVDESCTWNKDSPMESDLSSTEVMSMDACSASCHATSLLVVPCDLLVDDGSTSVYTN